jgi:hypothetical protein
MGKRFYFRPDVFADDAVEAVKEIRRLCDVALTADNGQHGANVSLLVKENAAGEEWVIGKISDEEMLRRSTFNPDFV